MLKLLVLRDRVKQLYGRYSSAVSMALRFLLSLSSMFLLNGALGYMKALRAPFIPLALAFVSAFCPWGGICWILAFFLLAHIFAVSLEFALFTAAFLLIVALLYYGFTPGDSVLLIITPLLFVLKLPYLVPILVGLSGALAAVIPMSCGVVIYYILQYVRGNAGPLTNVDSVDIAQKYVQMLNGVIMNRGMLLFIIAFAMAAIVVWLIHSLSVSNAWEWAVFAGMLVLLLVFFCGVFLYGIKLDIVPLILGCVLSGGAAELYRFFVFSVDYSRTEYTQFEDDDYYYYVKAVPKVSVSAPDLKIQKINTARRPKRARDGGSKNKG